MADTRSGAYVGIDISKARLDVAVHEGGAPWVAAYDGPGLSRLVARLKTLAPARIVVEATGGLETLLVAELAAAGLPVAVVNPRRVREFAKAIGLLAKTDRLDAGVVAHFAAAIRPPLTPVPSDDEQRLAELVTRRRQVVEMMTAERNRLGSAPARMRPRIQTHLDWMRGRIRARSEE